MGRTKWVPREEKREKKRLRERKGKSQSRKEKKGIVSSPKWIQLTGRWNIPYETLTGRWG
jgi:hypothetical protein